MRIVHSIVSRKFWIYIYDREKSKKKSKETEWEGGGREGRILKRRAERIYIIHYTAQG